MAEQGERLAKRMAGAGLCSRRVAETWIAAGRVQVNGKTITTPACVVTEADDIRVDGLPLPRQTEKPRLFMFYKPKGVLCTASDPQGRRTVFDLLPPTLPRLVLVGRLDLNSEGLLLLTTHGGLAEQLMHPRTGLARTYRVRFKGQMRPAYIKRMTEGMTVEGVTYRPMQVQMDDVRDGANQWATITIHEGKNREIRKVMGAFDLPVNRLLRVAYGPFMLADLKPGQIREVTGKQVASLLSQLGKDHA